MAPPTGNKNFITKKTWPEGPRLQSESEATFDLRQNFLFRIGKYLQGVQECFLFGWLVFCTLALKALKPRKSTISHGIPFQT